MTVGYGVLGQPHLQGTSEPARGMLDEMRQPVVGDRLPPVAQNFPGGWPLDGARMAHDDCP